MASLACPECRKEMIAQKDYDQALCSQCGRSVYAPGDKFRKVLCMDSEDKLIPENRAIYMNPTRKEG